MSVMFLPTFAFSQGISGNLSTSFWTFEDTSAHFVGYNQLRLNGAVPGIPGLSFRTNVRWSADLRGEVSETDNTRLYNALLDWKSEGGRLGMRIGRQYYTLGVGFGTLDGLMLDLAPARHGRLRVYGGIEAPVTREAALRNWSEGNVYGLHASAGRRYRGEVSWIRKSRNDEVYWHQVGTHLTARLSESLLTQLRLDYNVAASELQLLRLRGQYEPGAVGFWIEGSTHAPMITEDSFFRIFDLDHFSQVRLGARYKVSEKTAVTSEYIETIYSEDSARRLRIQVRAGMASIGIQVRGGRAGGEQTAFFGGITPTLGSVRGRVGFDVSQYKLSDRDRETDERTLSAGVEWRPPKNPFSARFQVQRQANRGYDPDYRGFGRLSLDF